MAAERSPSSGCKDPICDAVDTCPSAHSLWVETNLLNLQSIFLTLHSLPAQWDFTHNFMRAGVTALAALTLIAIGSIRPIRNAAFEIFLVSHIVLIL